MADLDALSRRTPDRFALSFLEMAPIALAGLAGVGLVMAMLGGFAALPAIFLGAIATVGIIALVQRDPPQQSQARIVRERTDGFAYATFGVFGIWNVVNSGAEVFIRRDPASYANTAAWLQRTGTLQHTVDWSAYGVTGPLPFRALAVYMMGEGAIEFQFVHGASVVMATASALSPRMLFTVTAIVASLSLALVYRLMKALGASASASYMLCTILGLSTPFLYTARSTYSEPYVAVVILAALLLGARGLAENSLALIRVSGLLTGSAMLFRIDGFLYVVAFFLALAVVRFNDPVRRPDWWTIVAVIIPVSIGTADLVFFTGGYEGDLRDRWTALAGLATAALLMYLLPLHRLAALVRLLVIRLRLARHPSRVAGVGGLATAAGFVVASRDPMSTISFWFGLSLIVLVSVGVSALLATVIVTWDRAQVFTIVFMAVATPLYVVRPSISPDQPWASRRLLGFALFALFALAALGVTRLLREGVGSPVVSRGIALVSIAALVLTILPASWQTRNASPGRGQLELIGEVATIADGRPVIVDGHAVIALPLLAFSGLDVMSLQLPREAQILERTVDRLLESEQQFVIVMERGAASRLRYASRLGSAGCLLTIEARVGPAIALHYEPQRPHTLRMRYERIVVFDPFSDCPKDLA